VQQETFCKFFLGDVARANAELGRSAVQSQSTSSRSWSPFFRQAAAADFHLFSGMRNIRLD
jgi:hypothetical protein